MHTPEKMEALTFLLMVLVVPGYSYVLQPSLTVTDIGGLDRETHSRSEWRLRRLSETPASEGEAGYEREGEQEATVGAAEKKKEGERRTDKGLTPETDYERGIMEDESAAVERASEDGLTPETDPAGRERTEGDGGEVELPAGFVENGDAGETEEAVDEHQGDEKAGGNEEEETSEETERTGEEDWTAADTEDGLIGGGREEVEKQGMEEREEKESELVAGIGPPDETREEGELEEEEEEEEDKRQQLWDKQGEKEEMESNMQNKEENIQAEKEADEVTETQSEGREDGDHTLITTFTPPAEGETAALATLQSITPSRAPPTAPPPVHKHNVLPTPPVNLPSVPTMSPSQVPSSLTGAHLLQLLPRSVTVALSTPTPTNQVWGVGMSHTQAPDVEEGKSVSLVEDDLIEVLNVNGSLRRRLKGKDGSVSEVLEVKVGQEDVKLKETKPKERKEVETVRKTKGANLLHNQKETNSTAKLTKPMLKPKKTNTITPPKETKLTAKELKTTAKSTDAKHATQDQKRTSTPKSKESNSTAKPVKPTPKSKVPRPTGKPKQAKSTGNETKPTVKQNKEIMTDPQVTNSTANTLQTQPTAAKTAAVKPSKINKNKTSKKKDKTRGKKGRKSNKTKKPTEKKKEGVTTPAYFPYFKDNYCPSECACYGRVVQCSDKGVDKIPYGVPFNARYILLMNNRIDSIQLDLLNQYLSMEFLVLSNNQLTDGTIEGSFEGVPVLKRLYLDRNRLESVPTDFPASLEELRLDNNHLRVMSEAAWARCPGLLVLSLSNNSLGNGSESLATGVLSPLANLRTLSLDYNQLESVPLGLPLSIKELYLRGNLIKRFRGGAFNGTSELVVLDLSANRLTNKGLLKESLLNATHLESLNLEGNHLKHVPRHLPLSLKTLNLEGNLISSINKATFNALPNLEHLGLARNKISRVAPGAFRTLPVLHQLDLCHNALRQVPRQLPRALYSAALTHNRIQSVPRDAFCWGETAPSLSSLVRVQLEHNLIDLGHLDTQAFRCLRGFQVVHFY